MYYKKIFWGAMLVLLGTALILRNLGVICFSWHSLWHLWPVLLILWGISILPIKDMWKLLISLVAIILTILFLYKAPSRYHDDWSFHWDSDDDNTSTRIDQSLVEEYDSTIKVAIVNLDAAAGKFELTDTSYKLIDFSNKGNIGSYSMELQRTGDTSIVDLKMHSRDSKLKIAKSGNKTSIKLNTHPVWNFNMDVGAAEIDLDFSPFKVSDIELNGGASSVKLRLGNLQKETRIDLETGASSIVVFIPEDAGCEVVTNTFLSNKNLNGFNKVRDKTYQTSNFSTAGQKISIKMDAAVSSIEVERY